MTIKKFQINENEAVVGIWHVEYDKPPRFVHKFVGYGRPTDVEWCGCTHHLLLIATDESVCAFDLKNLSPLWHAFEPNLRIAISAYCGVLYSSNSELLLYDLYYSRADLADFASPFAEWEFLGLNFNTFSCFFD